MQDTDTKLIIKMWKGEAPFFKTYWYVALLLLVLDFIVKGLQNYLPSGEATVFFDYFFKCYFYLEPALLLIWLIILIRCSDNLVFKGWTVIAGLSIIPFFAYRIHFNILFNILTGKL